MSDRIYGCPIESALEAIGGKWKCVILWHLRAGSFRTSELRRAIPRISEKMLIQQLRDLEADALVRRDVFEQVPPRVEYSLTDHARALQPALDALCAWGASHERQKRVAAGASLPPGADHAGQACEVGSRPTPGRSQAMRRTREVAGRTVAKRSGAGKATSPHRDREPVKRARSTAPLKKTAGNGKRAAAKGKSAR